MIRKKGKKTWASSKRQKMVITVGDCLHCNKQITNDMSFIIYATKQPSHYSCYKTKTEEEQNA